MRHSEKCQDTQLTAHLYETYADLPFFVINSEGIRRKHRESYGFAVTCVKTQRQILVRSLDSHAFVLFFRGVYHLSKVHSLVSQTTKLEYKQILFCIDDKNLFTSIFRRIHPEDYNNEVLEYAYSRLIDAAEIIKKCPEPEKTQTEFTYCRGQKKAGETELDCAYREFHEEIGVNLNALPHIITGEKTTSISRTSSGLCYTSIIYFVEVEEEFELRGKYDSDEISEVAWM